MTCLSNNATTTSHFETVVNGSSILKYIVQIVATHMHVMNCGGNCYDKNYYH